MLIIKHPGNRNTLFALNAAAFTRVNNAATAGRALGRIPANAPNGVLGGFAASMSGSYEVNICTNDKPIGFFLNDVAGSAYENTPAVASGKLTVMTAPGSYETDIYESVKEAGGALDVAWTASIGLALYVSNFGLLTTESTGSIIVGYVTKAPAADNPFLGFNTII
ncbi:MAG: hypothetical protein Q7R33_05175 [Nitrosarchaeum sp.]|nr:hypothetical protein [Nitrosarchaeum sp.]